MVVRIRLHRKSPATFPPLAKAEEEDLSPIPTAAVLHWGPLLSSPAQVGSSTRRFSSSFFFLSPSFLVLVMVRGRHVAQAGRALFSSAIGFSRGDELDRSAAGLSWSK